MKKELSVFLLPICMVACSQDSNVGETANAAVDMDSFDKVPVFAFGEDGARYDINLESGEQTKREMNRSKLVLANEDAFDSLKNDYFFRLRNDSDFAGGIESPVNYYCKKELLAINADYAEVVTSDGKVLLDDASLLDGCVDMRNDNALMKTTTFTTYPQTHTLNQFPIKMYAESDVRNVKDNEGHPTIKWIATAVTAVYLYTKQADGTVIYVPYEPKYATANLVLVNKNFCSGEGSGFKCSRLGAGENCYYREGFSNGGCWVFNNHRYGKNLNRTYYSWSLENDAWLNCAISNGVNETKKILAVVAEHHIVHGTNKVLMRTGLNVDQALADKIFNKYLGNQIPSDL